ncbi:VOC family protein [Actinoplanes couchii]|uniref:Glyoxalase-like domain-containing protein n=1 Tax=Actinoplanes couchii TaxID=403638 RepID=A0ABQ3XPJ1_9ACTN|nr:VOC family protein [Actinoplanes couchii]MDR6319076.1 hypothetical protein [Actinoplanes couchii]GID60419.1 hypothetical protein Aco03nite_088230 [Actinoplanes couchii]
MAAVLTAVCFDAEDPARQEAFWAAMLAGADPGFAVRFRPARVPKTGPNVAHFDLTSSSLDDQRATVDRALSLGARHLDIGQGPDADHVVLADPEGNEFDVIAPGNRFLAGCGFVGALCCDGTREVGYFWSRALGWPLVWDQDEETAIQSPSGGPKITWGGPPLNPNNGRFHFELTASETEIAHLLSLGATEPGGVLGGPARVLADPDGTVISIARRP